MSPFDRHQAWGISRDSVFWSGRRSAGLFRSPGIRDSLVVAPSRMIVQMNVSRFEQAKDGRILRGLIGNRGLEGIPLQRFDITVNIARRHSRQANVLFADGHVVSETLRQLLYPSVENWTHFNFDNRQHWNDADMSSPVGWKPSAKTWDERMDF